MYLKIYYIGDKVNYITIMPIKGTSKYHFINLTKHHICTCEFSSIQEAIADLSNYKEIIKVEKLGGIID